MRNFELETKVTELHVANAVSANVVLGMDYLRMGRLVIDPLGEDS